MLKDRHKPQFRVLQILNPHPVSLLNHLSFHLSLQAEPIQTLIQTLTQDSFRELLQDREPLQVHHPGQSISMEVLQLLIVARLQQAQLLQLHTAQLETFIKMGSAGLLQLSLLAKLLSSIMQSMLIF